LKELSLHILDVAENGISAGADFVQIEVDEARRKNRLTIVIKDNGRGIPEDILLNITDPFYTTRTTRKVGLGLSLLEVAANRCDGSMHIESSPGKGTCITTDFQYDHIDRAPLGDMTGTMTTLMIGNPDVDFRYDHRIDDKEFSVDSREVKEKFEDRPATDPMVFMYLQETFDKGFCDLE